MNNILFSILFSVFLIISCKKDNPISCEKTTTTLGSTNYVEQDTLIYKGKITVEVADLIIKDCKLSQSQFNFINLTDNSIYIKVYNDTTYKELFTELNIGPRKSSQTWLGPMQKGSKVLVPLIKVKYR